MRQFKEDDLQMSVAVYLDKLNLLWCHVANERRTSKQAGLRLKKKGVKPGVPDCLIFEPRGSFIGLAIELKIKPNKPTESQNAWLNKLKERGYCVAVCFDIDQVINVVTNYLKHKSNS